MFSEVIETICLVTSLLVDHVCAYVTNPHTILLNFVMFCLAYALHVDGEVKGRPLYTATAAGEMMVYVLWLTVSHGLRSVFAIWICLSVYDRIIRPTIHIQQESAYFIADESVEETLSQLNIQYESTTLEQDTNNGMRRITCVGLYIFGFKRYGYWIQQLELSDCSFKLEHISDVSQSCDDIIAKRFRTLGIQPERCVYLTMELPNGSRTQMSIVLVADTIALRDEWLHAIRELLALRIQDIRYAWLQKLVAESSSVCTSPNTQLVNIAINPVFASGVVVRETAIKVGRNIDFDQVLKILSLAGRQAERNYAKAQFKKFASVGSYLLRKLALSGPDSKQLTWEQFLALFSCAVNRPEIEGIYVDLIDKSSKSRTLTPNQFYDFVTQAQKEDVSIREVEAWIHSFEPVLQNSNLSSIGFVSYILAEEHSIFHRACNQIYQDMTQPLSHYFIATSHNTYLTKDQLTSKSSVDMYISAFKRGCKCVELDVWDGANGEPIICHGYTLTTKIHAKDVIQAVKNYAFCRSMYPVILSFENHLSVEQQKVLAKYLVDILGDMLYTKPIPANEKCLPSPDELKGYVLVKTKKIKPDCDESADDFYEDELFNMNTDELVDDVIAQKHRQMDAKQCAEGDDVSLCSSVSSDSDLTMDDSMSMKSEADEDESNETSEERKTKAFDVLVDALENGRKHNKEKIKPPRIAQEFSDLAIYCQATCISDFEQFKQNVEQRQAYKQDFYANVSLEESRRETQRYTSTVSSHNTVIQPDTLLVNEEVKITSTATGWPQATANLAVFSQPVRRPTQRRRPIMYGPTSTAKTDKQTEIRKHYEMISFGEKRAVKQSREDPVYWIQYNQRQLSRVYPGGGRIDSSNLDPVAMWNVGCQLVALNYQTPGPEMQLNQAMFQNNGLCGYVLKPEFMRQENPDFDPRIPGEKYDILAIQVLSAYQVPYKTEKSLKSERSLSVQVKIAGVEADVQCSRTKIVKNNGLNPQWNETFFFKVHVPELAFVVFTVLVKNVHIAQYTIPYQCLQQGYRRVPLLNKSAEPFSYSYLFTHINVQSPQFTSSNCSK